MRYASFIIIIILVFAGLMYYFSYGRLHNKIEPRLNITYQNRPTLGSDVNIINEPTGELPLEAESGGQCANLPKKQDVHALYVKSVAKDCGALNDNEAVMDEAESKNVLRCLENSITAGQCSNNKAFFTLQGFEGISEIFLESKDCLLNVKKWSTTSPSCGYSEESCENISEKFPFTLCDI